MCYYLPHDAYCSLITRSKICVTWILFIDQILLLMTYLSYIIILQFYILDILCGNSSMYIEFIDWESVTRLIRKLFWRMLIYLGQYLLVITKLVFIKGHCEHWIATRIFTFQALSWIFTEESILWIEYMFLSFIYCLIYIYSLYGLYSNFYITWNVTCSQLSLIWFDIILV